MKHSTTVKKLKAREKDLGAMEIDELQGFTNFVIGNVKKHGRKKVLESYMTIGGPKGPYWLKQMYLKVIEHAQEVRVKQITQNLKHEGKFEVNVMPPIKINGKELTFNV